MRAFSTSLKIAELIFLLRSMQLIYQHIAAPTANVLWLTLLIHMTCWQTLPQRLASLLPYQIFSPTSNLFYLVKSTFTCVIYLDLPTFFDIVRKISLEILPDQNLLPINNHYIKVWQTFCPKWFYGHRFWKLLALFWEYLWFYWYYCWKVVNFFVDVKLLQIDRHNVFFFYKSFMGAV